MTPETFDAKHLFFYRGPDKPKTKTWWVVNRHDDIQLGSIGWFARWRKYGFYPKPDTVYEETCLRDIARFCEQKTQEHRQARKAPTEQLTSKESEMGCNHQNPCSDREPSECDNRECPACEKTIKCDRCQRMMPEGKLDRSGTFNICKDIHECNSVKCLGKNELIKFRQKG